MFKTSSIIDARDEYSQRTEVLLKKLEEVSEQLKIPEPLHDQIQKKINKQDTQPRAPSDHLLGVISYVIQAENAGTLSETRQKTQTIREHALKIKEETAKLRAQIDALKEWAQEIPLVYQEQHATAEQIRQSFENFRTSDKN